MSFFGIKIGNSGGSGGSGGTIGAPTGDGQTITAALDFTDVDQSINRWAVGSAAGPTSLRVTDYSS